MVNIENKELCCGCAACAQRCPKQCISMRVDSEGFYYPVVESTNCIDCGLCERICHSRHPYPTCEPVGAYAAINIYESVRQQSSSGGIFHILAEKTIKQGGVVFGVQFDSEWLTEIGHAESMDDVQKFLGSKYVQANVCNSFLDAEKFLKAGRKVLFSGTPCQIAGLHHFLGKPYDNLTTVEVACHGVPSPKVWKIYLSEVMDAVKKITDKKFLSSLSGWRKYNFSIEYEESASTVCLHCDYRFNHFMRAFLCDLILRPSCYSCKAKDGRSGSDITIADFWGIEHIKSEMDDDKGTSLVIANTPKGQDYLEWSKTKYCEAEYAHAKMFNGGLNKNAHANPKRKAFFDKLDNAYSVVELVNKCTKPTFKNRAKASIKDGLRNILGVFFLKKIVRGSKHSPACPNTAIPPDLIFANYPTSITFRDKISGWKTYSVTVKIETHNGNSKS